MRRFSQLVTSQSITRREFLKFGGLGMLAAFGVFPPASRKITTWLDQFSLEVDPLSFSLDVLGSTRTLLPNQQGRVLDAALDVYDAPSFSGKRVNQYFRDWVLPITGVTIGKSIDSFNLVWYKVGAEGYVHSGSLQPVFTITNPVRTDIPPGGNLGEVTVPFTDAHWDPGQEEPVAYRYYYATTTWVVLLAHDAAGNPWYGIRYDKWDYMYYVPAAHLRLVPAEELKPRSANLPGSEKRIAVHLPEQVMIAYERDRPVFMARVASGAIFSTGNFSTPPGWYQILHKRASRHMARGNLAAGGYDLPGVPWNSYITEDGIAFHGTYWHNNFGHPRSHGCINLTSQAAKWVYLWTLPEAPADQEDVYDETGTNVEVIE